MRTVEIIRDFTRRDLKAGAFLVYLSLEQLFINFTLRHAIDTVTQNQI